MLRTRNTQRWGQVTEYKSPHEFLARPVKPGVNTVWLKDHSLDLLTVDRRSPLTLVFFHGAATSKAQHYPILQGEGVAERSSANLVAVADPTLQMGDIDLAWYIGNKHTGPLRASLAPLIRHAVDSLPGQRTLLVGASGGGFAALSFASLLPNSIVLPINPRTHLNRRPFPAQRMVDYLKVAHGAKTNTGLRSARRKHVTDDVIDLLPDALNFDLLLYQNLEDHLYLTRQVIPLIERYRADPRLYVRFEQDGKGHVPIPRSTLDSIVSSLAVESRTQKVIRSAGFEQASLVSLPTTKTPAPES